MAAHEPHSGFASNGGVRLHYIAAGAGEPVLFVHGIPDFCEGWRHQIEALSARYRTAAMDLRGFNRSDKPSDPGAYSMLSLIADVAAVIRALGNERVTLIGHDWGAILCWWVATLRPQMVLRLAALSAPHPLCYLLARERGELCYPREFLEQIVSAAPGAPFDASTLSAWVSDAAARRQLAEALGRSDPEAMRNYYRVNLPAQPAPQREVPRVEGSTLIMYGADDDFIPQRYYDESAKHVAGRCSVISIPGAGHFIHREAAEAVTAGLVEWLGRTG